MTMHMGIGDRLGQVRRVIGFSCQKVDEVAGLTPGHTWAVETGKRPRMEVGTVLKIAAALGLSLDWLLLGKGRAPGKRKVARAVARATAKRGRVSSTGLSTAVEVTPQAGAAS